MSDALTLVPMTAEERASLHELPIILRALKLALASVPAKSSAPSDGKVTLSLNAARKLAGVRAATFLHAVEAGEIAGSKKISRGRIGQWRLPRAAVLEWIKSQP